MKRAINIWAILILTLVVGCAQLGLEEAKSFDEKLAYGYSTVSSLRASAAMGVSAGTIRVNDAQYVLTLTDQARFALDGARAASGAGDMSTAIGRLTAATSILVQIQKYLASKGVN